MIDWIESSLGSNAGAGSAQGDASGAGAEDDWQTKDRRACRPDSG